MRFIRLIFATPFYLVAAIILIIAIIIGGKRNSDLLTKGFETINEKIDKFTHEKREEGEAS